MCGPASSGVRAIIICLAPITLLMSRPSYCSYRVHDCTSTAGTTSAACSEVVALVECVGLAVHTVVVELKWNLSTNTTSTLTPLLLRLLSGLHIPPVVHLLPRSTRLAPVRQPLSPQAPFPGPLLASTHGSHIPSQKEHIAPPHHAPTPPHPPLHHQATACLTSLSCCPAAAVGGLWMITSSVTVPPSFALCSRRPRHLRSTSLDTAW